MTPPRRTTAIYNPSLLARDELIATFAARGPLLATLVDDVRRGGKQHHLIIGQRGAGKTTLLLRLACALEDDAELAGNTMPLRFPEEQYNVGRPSDFWLNCVDALIDGLERRGEVVAARKLDAEVDRLEDLDEDERAHGGLALLTGWTKQARRLLVLLVDNVDLVLERLAGQHWALREVLSADNRLMLIGASSTFIQESFSYGEAFYDFFRIHELAPLSEDEARAMLLRLADATGAAHVHEALAEPGRFAALHLMSGGMPRTLVLLHRILASQSSARAEDDLEALLDQVTPYYKARFDELPAQSQLVVHALAMHWHPMTAVDCGASAHLDVNVVSSQLNRLVRQGLVRKLASADSSKLSFLISERFFAIWYSMRASRRLRRRLLWLVEAVEAFYGHREVERRAQELLATCEAADAGDPARMLAYASKVEDGAVRAKLEFRAVQALVGADLARGALAELLDVDGEDRHLMPVIDRVRTLKEIRQRVASTEGVDPTIAARAADWIVSQFAFGIGFKVWLANKEKQLIERLGRLPVTPNELQGLQDAIGRGEVPAPADAVNEQELDQIAALVPAETDRVFMMGLFFASAIEQVSDKTYAHAVKLAPSAAAQSLWAIASHLRPDRTLPPDEVARLVRKDLARTLRLQTELSIGHFATPSLWRPFVEAGWAAEIAELLREYGWHERLPLLYEALRAAGEGRRGDLVYLAPEVRKPTEEVLAELLAGDPVPEARPAAYQAPAGKASRAPEPKPSPRSSPRRSRVGDGQSTPRSATVPPKYKPPSKGPPRRRP